MVAVLSWLSYSFPRENWDQFLKQRKDWVILSASLAVVLVANIVSFLRWRLLVRSLEVPFTANEAIRLGFLGCLFNLVSAGSVGGDLFKAIAAARSRDSKRAEVVGSVLVDRAMGLLGLVVVAALSLQFLPSLTGLLVNSEGAKQALPEYLEWTKRGAWLMAAIGVGSITAVVLAGRYLPLKWVSKIPVVGHGCYRMAHAGLIFEGRPWLAIQMLSVSLIVHSLITFGIFLASAGLYASPPELSKHFMAIPPAMAAGAIPISPGGFGVQEGAIDFFFKLIPGVPETFSGLLVAGMYRMMTFVVAGIGACYYFLGKEELKRVARGEVLDTPSSP